MNPTTHLHKPLLALAVVVCMLPAASVQARSFGVWKHLFGAEFGPAAPVAEVNDPGAADGCPIESPDGLSLVIASTRGPGGDLDLWSAERRSTDEPFDPPAQVAAPINGPADDFCPTPVGRSLFFVSARPAECSGGNIYLSRQDLDGDWQEPKLLPCAPAGPNFNDGVFSPTLVKTSRGTYLFYSSFGEQGDHDIYVSRLGPDGEFGPGHRVDALSNVGANDRMPNIRYVGRGAWEVVFSSSRPTWGRRNEPAFGGQDVYRAVSWKLPFKWTTPVNLGPNVNTESSETRSSLSADGERLYFGRDGDIYVSER